MFAPSRRALSAYANVQAETGVAAASPHGLILMLFDGAQVAVANARRHLRNNEIAARGSAVSKAIAIIDDGLRASLDMNSGGELAQRLSSLYRYLCERLLQANAQGRVEGLDEVDRLLGELRGAWAAIGDKAPNDTNARLNEPAPMQSPAQARPDWDQLIELENQCRALFQSLPALDDSIPSDQEYQYRKAALIHEILDNDERIRNQVAPRCSELQFLLDNTTRARLVESRYGASDCVS